MTITLQDLQVLNEKATQGEWHFSHQPARVGDKLIVGTQKVSAMGDCCLEDGGSTKNLEFIAALVNYYRSGALQRLAELAEDGWVMVPMEPTDAMLEAAQDSRGLDGILVNDIEVWKGMVAAAPARAAEAWESCSRAECFRQKRCIEPAYCLSAGRVNLFLLNRGQGLDPDVGSLDAAMKAIDAALSSRPAIIDECARVCEEGLDANFNESFKDGMRACAAAIRALAPREQNAYTAAAGYPLEAQSRAAPAEVAEGAPLGEEARTAYWKAKALRAAPSLTKEEWGMLNNLLEAQFRSLFLTTVEWRALRAKLREQEREGKS